MIKYKFTCRETNETFAVSAANKSDAMTKANEYFRPLWSKAETQFYGWMGNGSSFYASYGVWD